MNRFRRRKLLGTLSKIIFPVVGMLVVFGLFLGCGVRTIELGRRSLYFCAPFYNLLFTISRSISSALAASASILIPAGTGLLILLGSIIFFKSRRKYAAIAYLFFSMGLVVLSYGLLSGDHITAGLIISILAMIGMGAAAIFSSSIPSGNSGGTSIRSGIILSLILIFTLINCFYRLEIHPYHLSGWEVSGGISVIQLTGGDHPEYAKLLWSSLERPLNGSPACPFFVYHLALLFKLFGMSILVIRSTGIFWGVVSLIILYQLVKDLFSPRTALLAVFLTSVSPWFLSITRYGGYLTLSLCYLLLVLFLFLRGVGGRGRWYLPAAGGLTALFSYFYLPVKILFPLLALIWIHSLFFTHRTFLKKIIGIGGFFIGFFLISLILGNPFPKMGGAAMPNIFIGSPPGDPGFNLTVALDDLKQNSVRLFYNLFYRSHSVEFPAPQALLIEHGVLLLSMLGLGWCVGRWKNTPYFFLILGAILPLLPVLIISSRMYDHPLARRGFLIMPFLTTLAALTLNNILNSLDGLGKRSGRITGAVVCTLLLTTFTVGGLKRYFTTPAHPYLAVKRAFVERCLQLMDRGYYLEIAESDYHLRELLDFLSFPMTGQLYTYYPYPGDRYTHTGRVSDITNYRTIGESPFYNFWAPADFNKTLSRAGVKEKAAILLENEFPYETRPLLMEIRKFDPLALIEQIRNKDQVIGFQYLLPEKK